MSKQHTAFFVVTGGAFTERARALLLDDDPGRAFRLLAEGLIGDGALEAALQVLRGESNITGDSSSGLRLVKARSSRALTSYKKNLRYVYAGRFKRGSAWFRPVAWLDDFTNEDAAWASEDEDLRPQEWNRQRARYYADDDGDVELLELPGEGNVWVLLERCSERPHWERPPLTAQEALDEAIAAGRCIERREPPKPEPEPAPAPRRPSAEELERADREQEAREAQWEARQKQIGEDVRARAGTDTFELALGDGRKLTIPRAPFVRWALSRTEWSDTAPPWENVATSGFKLPLDNPDHTDWVLGAGIDLSEAYDRVLSDAAWDAAMELQSQAREAAERTSEPKRYAGIFAALEGLNKARHEAAVITDAGECTGVVGVDIAVLPDSQADRVAEIEGCKGVVVEQGGPLAHLAVVSREFGITIMRHRNARALFKPGMVIALNPVAGRITIVEGPP